jgi:hydrogenase nickel incorporation protein HypA/HybF
MHELSIAQAVVDTVRAAVGPREVESVHLTVGALAGVVPSALEFVWDIAASGTSLQGSALQITWVPASVWCARCDSVVAPEVGFLCPVCGELSGDVRTGRELEVTSARVRDEAATA